MNSCLTSVIKRSCGLCRFISLTIDMMVYSYGNYRVFLQYVNWLGSLISFPSFSSTLQPLTYWRLQLLTSPKCIFGKLGLWELRGTHRYECSISAVTLVVHIWLATNFVYLIKFHGRIHVSKLISSNSLFWYWFEKQSFIVLVFHHRGMLCILLHIFAIMAETNIIFFHQNCPSFN